MKRLGVVAGPCLLLALAAGRAETAKREKATATFIATLGRILEMEDTRSVGGGELDRLLSSREPGIRRRAALAAGRIADPANVPTLVGMMNDQEPRVREMVAFALGLARDPSAVDRLAAALSDSDPGVRARAAEALGRIGDSRAGAALARFVVAAAPSAEGPITVRGDDPADPDDPWIEPRLGLVALGLLKDEAGAQAALLVGNRPRFDWWVSTWVALRLESRSLRPVLLAAARSDDPLSRALAARGLGALGDTSAHDVLAALARDEEPRVALEALRALGRTGDEGGRALAADALSSRSDVVRHEALLTLAALEPDRRLRAQIVPFVGDPSPWMRAAALTALAHTDRADFALVLSGMDPDPVWFVRAALATALGKQGDEMSVSVLHAMLQDEDARVLPAVLSALHRARGNDSLDTLLRHLEHPDMGVRAAAAEELGRVKEPGLVPALLDAVRRGRGDGELEPRLVGVEALAAQGEDAVAALEEVATSDPSRAVRARAHAALLERGAPSPPPGPERVDRPSLDYREAMAPFYPFFAEGLYTPRAFVHTKRGVFEIHLDVVEAPLTSAAFVRLARRGFYDGLTFHRVEPGFVVQGGCPRGDGYGGPGFSLRDEITRRSFGRGAVGLALAGPDTGGSQFFVTLAAQPQLDGRYPLFGTVVSGMEVVDEIRPGDVIDRIEVWTGPAAPGLVNAPAP
jgi:cyclophilin family peptidyl-prolyl cis-trans isomerase/HEAT repeat protein